MEVRGIIHDLNNALTTVLGHAEWLLSLEPEGSPRHREADAIRAAAENAARLTRDLREWVRAGAPAPPARANVPLAPMEPPRLPHAGRRLLLVDDQPEVRDSLAEMLRLLGHDVTTAANGREGLQRLVERPIDLILTDFSMPDMDGLALAMQAGRLRPGVPVLLLTGWGHEIEGRPEAICGVLPKPVTLRDLRNAVERAAA
ncbi:MAG: response regulator [Vicinamibacterales bacterium]|nr:response regulator [Vicinamibacterales bacterium]